MVYPLGVIHRSTRAEREEIHPGCTLGEKGLCTLACRPTARRYVIDKYDGGPSDGFAGFKSTDEVLPSEFRREARLLPRPTSPSEPIVTDIGQSLGKQVGLIEPSRTLSSPMDGYRDKRVGVNPPVISGGVGEFARHPCHVRLNPVVFESPNGLCGSS